MKQENKPWLDLQPERHSPRNNRFISTLEGKSYFFLLGFIFLTLSFQFFQKKAQRGNCPLLHVEVQGEVRKPGTYIVPRGTPLSQLLEKAKCKPLSDLKKLNLSQALEKPDKITVSKKLFIERIIEGAVEKPGLYLLPSSCRICDLTKYVAISAKADKKFMRSKRKIYSKKRIEIPFSIK